MDSSNSSCQNRYHFSSFPLFHLLQICLIFFLFHLVISTSNLLTMLKTLNLSLIGHSLYLLHPFVHRLINFASWIHPSSPSPLLSFLPSPLCESQCLSHCILLTQVFSSGSWTVWSCGVLVSCTALAQSWCLIHICSVHCQNVDKLSPEERLGQGSKTHPRGCS